MFHISLEVLCSLHNKSWWQLTGQWTLASQGTPASQGPSVFYEHCSHMKGEKVLEKYHWIRVMQDTGHPGKTIGTLQVVSFLIFSPGKHPQCILCTHAHPYDVITAKTTTPSGRAHPHVSTVQV